MDRESVRTHLADNGTSLQNRQPAPTRREFVGAVVGGAFLRTAAANGEPVLLRLPPGRTASRVIRAHGARVVENGEISRQRLRELLDATLVSLTGDHTPSAAWRRILRSDDVVGLKFNRSGQSSIATTPATARAIVESLIDAGWKPGQIVCIEAPPGTEAALGTTAALEGFEPTLVDFGSGVDQVARVLSQVTALVNVPYLKTHNITGVTCSLKNLSHGLIRHPGRFHRNRCDPFIADIVAIPAIREKLRLTLVDALRIVFEGGPNATNGTISDEGMLLASTDPVATDLVGLTVINEVRARRGLPAVAESAVGLPFLATAHRKGLGVAVWHGIDLGRVGF